MNAEERFQWFVDQIRSLQGSRQHELPYWLHHPLDQMLQMAIDGRDEAAGPHPDEVDPVAHCWVCDAAKPHPDAACGCDGRGCEEDPRERELWAQEDARRYDPSNHEYNARVAEEKAEAEAREWDDVPF